MRSYIKITACFCIVFLLSSLTVRSETAPNLLELTEGIVIIGDTHQEGLFGTANFSVDKIWYDPFFDEDIVEISRGLVQDPPYDPILNVSSQQIKSLVVKDNRTVYIPAISYDIKSGDDFISIFVNYTDDLNVTVNDLMVTYNGITYVYNEMDPYSAVYENVSFWMMSWAVGNVFELQLMPLLRYAISPQATIGQEIEYGKFTGEVMGFTEYYISETEYFEVIEVHHNEEIVIINLFGTDQPYVFGDTTLLYEKNTGIILHWLEYNSTSYEYYYYNATEVIGISPISIPEFSVPLIIVLSSILIAIPILISRRKKE